MESGGETFHFDLPIAGAGDALEQATLIDLIGGLLEAVTNDTTVSELTRIRAEAQRGSLDPDDVAYVIHLSKRLGHAVPSPAPSLSSEELVRHLRMQLDAAGRRIGELETRVGELLRGNGDRQAFLEIKREFARRYHPGSEITGIERLVREEIFKEFWVVIQRVEKRHFTLDDS